MKMVNKNIHNRNHHNHQANNNIKPKYKNKSNIITSNSSPKMIHKLNNNNCSILTIHSIVIMPSQPLTTIQNLNKYFLINSQNMMLKYA
jgi:hypothetical protein